MPSVRTTDVAAQDHLTSQLNVRADLAAALKVVADGRSAPALAAIAERVRELDRGEDGQSSAYGLTLEAIVNAVQWREAVNAAERDAVRFRDAARVKARQAGSALRRPYPPHLEDAINVLSGLADPLDEVARAATILATVPLPLRVLGPPDYHRRFRPVLSEQPPLPMPVDVELMLDGQRVSDLETVVRDRLLRLEAHVRMDEWPAGAEDLRIELLSDVPSSAVARREIVVPAGMDRGTATIMTSAIISPLTPVELMLSARFTGDDSLPAVRLLGDGRLCLATSDGADELPAGFPAATERIAEMIRELDAKRLPLTHDDRVHLLRLLGGALSFWSAAVDGHISGLTRPVRESQFQAALAAHLQANPRIANELVEARRLGGGPSDLLLGRVVDELKVENDKPVTLETALDYHDQTASYAAPIDCAISVLTVLDASPKTRPPALIGNNLGWVYPEVHGRATFAPSMVAVAIVPVGFPTPSTFSRSSRGRGRARGKKPST